MAVLANCCYIADIGVIETCVVPVGQPPKWTAVADSKRDQIVYHGRCGIGRHEQYSLLRWDGGKTVLPLEWFEEVRHQVELRPFLRDGKPLTHSAVGPIVLVEHRRAEDAVIVRRVRWPWAFLGQWYRIRRRLCVLRDWVKVNRTWLKQNW